MFFFDIYIKYLRACAVCGFSLGKINWLCLSCEKEFLSRLSLKERWIDSVKHIYLIDWKPGDPFVDQLVYSLKGEGLFESYLRMVLIYSSLNRGLAPDVIYYPSKGYADHGSQWGRAFAEIYECPCLELKLVENKKQALLSLKERSKRDFQGSVIKAKNPYFVDDIVTSGATARAASQRIGQQGKLTIWSLFYRRTCDF